MAGGDGLRQAGHQCFHHEMLAYSGDDGFLRGALPFIDDGLAAHEPVLVAVGGTKLELLKEALGGRVDGVLLADMRVLGRNPARIIPAWHQFLRANASDGRSARGVGEPIWPGRSPAELAECQRHESLLNLAFDDGQAWRLLCPYDVDGLDDQVIEAARRSHPFIAHDGGSSMSDRYENADLAENPFGGTLPPPAGRVREIGFTGEDLGALRHLVFQRALEFELGHDRAEQLVLAASEVASNSVRHGGGRGTLQVWSEKDTLLVEIHDRGHIEDPLVGRSYPAPDDPDGRGLWLVNRLCDLVQIRSSSEGSVVRLQMRRT